MRVLIFSTTFIEIFQIIKRIRRDIVINVKTSSCEVFVILGGFFFEFSRQIFEKKKL